MCAELSEPVRRTLKQTQVCYIYKLITPISLTIINQIVVPNKEIIEIPTQTLDALNSWVVHYKENVPVSSFADILDRYPSAQPGPSGSSDNRKVVSSQHCELSLSLHIAKISNAHGPVKIGCSKASCYWCHLYLEKLNSYFAQNGGLTIVCRATHGKKTNGWLLPTDGPNQVKQAFLESVGTEIQEMFNIISEAQPGRSDSWSIREVIDQDDTEVNTFEPPMLE